MKHVIHLANFLKDMGLKDWELKFDISGAGVQELCKQFIFMLWKSLSVLLSFKAFYNFLSLYETVNLQSIILKKKG